MPTVFLVRHGQTEWNRTERIQGWAAVPLNDRGQRQARAAGRHLRDREFDRLVASDLLRTRETTAHIRSTGEFPEPEFTRGWRERSFGAYQGLSYDRVFGDYPEHNAGDGMIGLESTPQRGESLLEARERVMTAWAALLERADPDDEVLVVTHGGPIYILLAAIKGVDLPTAITEFEQHNCAINELHHDDTTEIRRENDITYREQEIQ